MLIISWVNLTIHRPSAIDISMRKTILFFILGVSLVFAWGFLPGKSINTKKPLEAKQYGTVHYDKEKTESGYTLVSSRANKKDVDYQTSEIIDMEGNIIHQWKTAFEYSSQENKADRDHQLTRLLPGGDALVLTYEKGLGRIDWNSQVLWNLDGYFHHDIQVTDDYIYTLKWQNDFIEYGEHILPIMDEILVTIDHDGNIISEVSLFDTFSHLLPEEAYENILNHLYKEDLYDLMQTKPQDYYLTSNLPWDIFHMNALHYIRQDSRIFEKGQFLVSMRSINTIAVFDPETLVSVWEYTDELIKQHNPTLLDNGNILIYDNGGIPEFPTAIVDGEVVDSPLRRLYTRLVEINPESKEVVWEYTATPKPDFYGKIMGSAQRLENGNTLTVNALGGVIYEITSDGEIVWEHHAEKDGISRYRAYRLTEQEHKEVDSLL